MASIATRPIRSMPLESIAMLERPGIGGWSSPPFRIRIPVGAPAIPNRSPLIPATVAPRERRFSIVVSFSVFGIVSFDSTGWIDQSPPGRGTVSTLTTIGPVGVNSTLRS